MTRHTPEILTDALYHFKATAAYAERNMDDQLVIDAICMRLAAGIETLSTLDSDLRTELFGADWSLMWGMRNRIAHGYLLVDSGIVRQTLRDDLPTIISRIEGRLTTET